VWTVDACVEGVHFERRLLTLEQVGAKSFHAAVSDVAAMGARPLAALSSIVVPARRASTDVPKIARGQARAARELRCPVVGGNLANGEALSVTTTVLGVADRSLGRSGARPGDALWLLGRVGCAAAGLRLVQQPRRVAPGARAAVGACIAAWRSPRALVAEGISLVGRARAVIDVSDGLGTDARHLAEASGVRVVLEESALRRGLSPELIVAAAALAVDPLTFALSGGEDYALLASGPPPRRPRGAKTIGRVETGRASVVLESPDGRRARALTGFDHFRRGG
jgi:thiamine-monophosphate kinase